MDFKQIYESCKTKKCKMVVHHIPEDSHPYHIRPICDSMLWMTMIFWVQQESSPDEFLGNQTWFHFRSKDFYDKFIDMFCEKIVSSDNPDYALEEIKASYRGE